MWELLLGIAVKCPEKNTYIKMILGLDEQSQAALMSLINAVAEDCPELSSLSGLDDAKDQKLEAALLNTIDELTEENGQLREQLEALEEQLEALRASSGQEIAGLKEQLQALRDERLEVLGEYETEYCSDSLLSIFKSLEAERDQLVSSCSICGRVLAICVFYHSTVGYSRDTIACSSYLSSRSGLCRISTIPENLRSYSSSSDLQHSLESSASLLS